LRNSVTSEGGTKTVRREGGDMRPPEVEVEEEFGLEEDGRGRFG
jgi:hypothetical protein